MAYSDDNSFKTIEEIFKSAAKQENSSKKMGSNPKIVSEMQRNQQRPRVIHKQQGIVYPQVNQKRVPSHRVVSSSNLKVSRVPKSSSLVTVLKRKRNPLLIKIGALSFAGVISVVGFMHVIKRINGKDNDLDNPQTSISVDGDVSTVSVLDDNNSKGLSTDSSSNSFRYFSLNRENVTKCEKFKETDFGKYMKDICVKYGQDYDLLVAQFYQESHLEHYDVLPVQYSVDNSPVANDNGENWFNGTGFGMTQLTVDNSVKDARVVSTGELVELINNEENAADPYTNVELGVMTWQDNQFRTLFLIVESYNEAIGIKNCFTYDNIKRILNGEHVGLPVNDEKYCVTQIMSALGIASLDNYNHGLGNFENYILPSMFDKNGNFLYKQYIQSIKDFCSAHEDSGDPNYINNVMANFENDEFSFYVNRLDGFATFSICKEPNQCFVDFKPRDLTYSYEDGQFKMR